MIFFNEYKYPLLYIENKDLKNEIEYGINDGSITEQTLNKIYILQEEVPDFQLNDNVKLLSEENGQKLFKLIFNIIYNYKKYSINTTWEIYKGEYLYIPFDYHPTLVAKVKKLKTSNWLQSKKTWIVHVSEWREIEKIFKSTRFDFEELYQNWRAENAKTRLIITEKTCKLNGINIPLEEIHLATSFEDVNAKHTTSYKNGNWDGRIALFDQESRMFPIGLLSVVVDILNKYNIQYEIEDRRSCPDKKYNFEENVSLRDYQEVVVNKALMYKSGILQLATGAGKTKIACSITSKLGLNTVFFVHTHFLLNQAKKELEKVLNIEVGQIGGGVIDIKPVTVAMIQTTIQALGKEYVPSIDEQETGGELYIDDTDISGREEEIKSLLENANVVFFDECQFVAAESFYTVANTCSAFYKFGLSATPYRSDKKDPMIVAALGNIISRVSASYLIKRGFLTTPKIHFFNISGSNIKEDKRKYPTVYKEEIIENPERNEKIVKSVKRLISKNRSVLILVQQITHGEYLQKMLLEEGIITEFVYGLDNIEKREQEIEKLRYKKSLCLIASTIADEGLDVPSLDAVILAGGGKSPSKSLQRVGRAIRKYTEYNQKEDLDYILGNNPHSMFTVYCNSANIEEYLLNSNYSNFNLINSLEDLKNNINSDSYIFINCDKNIEINDRIKNIIEFSSINEIHKGSVILFNTKKEMSEFKKEHQLKSKEFKELNSVEDIPLKIEEDCIYALKLTLEKSNIVQLSKIFNFVYLYNISDKFNYLFEKDKFILNEKNEAFIVDFIDNKRYLLGHSLERLSMFKTEKEFQITGI